jgi:hypothetical protein
MRGMSDIRLICVKREDFYNTEDLETDAALILAIETECFEAQAEERSLTVEQADSRMRWLGTYAGEDYRRRVGERVEEMKASLAPAP